MKRYFTVISSLTSINVSLKKSNFLKRIFLITEILFVTVICCVFFYSCKEKKPDNTQHKVISNYTETKYSSDSVYFNPHCSLWWTKYHKFSSIQFFKHCFVYYRFFYSVFWISVTFYQSITIIYKAFDWIVLHWYLTIHAAK
jgi:hypothetical protein